MRFGAYEHINQKFTGKAFQDEKQNQQCQENKNRQMCKGNVIVGAAPDKESESA